MALTRYGELRNNLMRRSFPTVFAPVVLRDADSNYVPIPISERLVQCIWYDQRLQADTLQTIDGRRVRVIFQGWWNLEAGPDFRHATIQIGDGPEQTGDVEVHLRSDDWSHHGHNRDPNFNRVILHVVLWEAGSEHIPITRAGALLPQVVLQHQLAAPLESLYDEIDLDAYPHNAGNHTGRCAQILQALPASEVSALLDAAGEERFAAKSRRYARWIHRAGAEQAFFEAWMEALGYKANKAPFRLLAQRLTLARLQEHRAQLAALIFGAANFLPAQMPKKRDSSSSAYVKKLWSQWWKLRPDFEEQTLPADAWQLHGIRPANHPHRRLGAAVALLRKHPNFLEKVIGAVESDGDPLKFFDALRDEYWSHHFTLGGKTQTRVTELVGASRAREIVTNVILPFVAAVAKNSSDDRLLAKTSTLYTATRPAPSNSVLRLAGLQLFGGAAAAKRVVRSARQQQGLLQIFSDFCLNDKSACRQCQFPELVNQWRATDSLEVG